MGYHTTKKTSDGAELSVRQLTKEVASSEVGREGQNVCPVLQIQPMSVMVVDDNVDAAQTLATILGVEGTG